MRCGLFRSCSRLPLHSPGGVKLVLPGDVLQEQMQLSLPGVFIRFIGVVELLGAAGLILPGVLRVRPHFTPLAAAGLVAVTLGAVMFIPPDSEPVALILPVVLGVLAAFVAYARWRPANTRSGRGASRSSAGVR
jgi:hypothetical protein